MVKTLKNDLCCRVCGAKFTSRDDFPFAQKIYMERNYSCNRKKAGIPA